MWTDDGHPDSPNLKAPLVADVAVAAGTQDSIEEELLDQSAADLLALGRWWSRDGQHKTKGHPQPSALATRKLSSA